MLAFLKTYPGPINTEQQGLKAVEQSLQTRAIFPLQLKIGVLNFFRKPGYQSYRESCNPLINMIVNHQRCRDLGSSRVMIPNSAKFILLLQAIISETHSFSRCDGFFLFFYQKKIDEKLKAVLSLSCCS